MTQILAVAKALAKLGKADRALALRFAKDFAPKKRRKRRAKKLAAQVVKAPKAKSTFAQDEEVEKKQKRAYKKRKAKPAPEEDEADGAGVESEEE